MGKHASGGRSVVVMVDIERPKMSGFFWLREIEVGSVGDACCWGVRRWSIFWTALVYISTYNGITLIIAKLVKVVQIRQKMFLREKKLDSTFIDPGSSLFWWICTTFRVFKLKCVFWHQKSIIFLVFQDWQSSFHPQYPGNIIFHIFWSFIDRESREKRHRWYIKTKEHEQRQLW